MLQLGHGNERDEVKGTLERSAPDVELVRAAQRGDKRAFVEIVARQQAMVCGIALAVLGDFAESEDAGQEAFLTAWRKIHELREPERWRAWLVQIARNAALGHLRRRRGHDPLDDAPDLADEAPLPDEVAARKEEAALVRDSLTKLPEAYRLALILYYREDQCVRAVAETLGISEDAVKQRLARGRDMLRDRVSGLIENVISRTGPTPIFTMTVAAAIGALEAPAAMAGTAFTASAAAGTTTTSTSATGPVITALGTSKAFLVTTVLVTVASIPVGYFSPLGKKTPAAIKATSRIEAESRTAPQNAHPSFENSVLFAEWRKLHDTYGTTSEAMPALYRAIADLKDPFRRRAFHAALIAEWAQVDPARGLTFFLGEGRNASERRQFFDEWLRRDARAAVDALMASGPGWEGLAHDTLTEIARRVPSRLAEILPRLPKANGYWDPRMRDAFAVAAESDLASARIAAETMTGPNREQALAGVAKAWAKIDLDRAIAWARALPDGTDRDEIIRAGLLGVAATDPVAALDRVGLVPSGGRQNYQASTTGARVLTEAAKADFDATVAWVAAHPGRFGNEDMMGMAKAVADRLNADAAGFLTRHTSDGSLGAILPAVTSVMLNDASQHAVIWDWLKTQPDDETSRSLRKEVLISAALQDPTLALRLVGDLPRTPEGDKQVQTLARCLLNGGSMLHRFDGLLEQAPERLRQPLIDAAFDSLHGGHMKDPQSWIDRLSQLPEASRSRATESIARAWAERAPEDAIGWVASLAPGDTRSGAVAAVASAWAAKDAHGASGWVASMSAGVERDRSAQSLVLGIAEKFPREAWDWALSISDITERNRTAAHVAKMMASRDPATAWQWIEIGPFTPEKKAELQSALGSANRPSTPH